MGPCFHQYCSPVPAVSISSSQPLQIAFPPFSIIENYKGSSGPISNWLSSLIDHWILKFLSSFGIISCSRSQGWLVAGLGKNPAGALLPLNCYSRHRAVILRVPGPAAASGNLSETQILMPCSRPTESNSGDGAQQSVLRPFNWLSCTL